MSYKRRAFHDFPHNRKWQIKIVDGKFVVHAVETRESHTFNTHADAVKFIYEDIRATYPWKFRG